MIKLQAMVPVDRMDDLETYFCEEVRSNWGLFQDKLENPLYVFGYFEDDTVAETAWAELKTAFPELDLTPTRETIEDRDWKEAYKAHLGPWVCEDLHWVPVWRKESYPVPEGEPVVYFDAGLAFGTGDHPTTRLMAMRLLDYRKNTPDYQGKRVIDAGCGSGILAISAHLLGFGDVLGFDRDPEAVRVSRENLVFNGMKADVIPFLEGGIEAVLVPRQADLILANIQADVLGVYAECLVNATAPGGTLAMSGILAVESEALKAQFENVARALRTVATVDTRVMGEWSDLCLVFAD